MVAESFRVSTVVRATPAQIYEAWLDGERHGKMTGGDATGEPVLGSRFTAWGGYITGTNVELSPGHRIVQHWRSTEFPADAPDSVVEIVLEPDPAGTRLTLSHSEIPEGQGESYRKGWDEHYFQPMKTYFGRAATTDRPPASRPPVAAVASPGEAAPAKAPAKKASARKKPAVKRPAAKAAAKKAPAKKAAAKRAAPKKRPAKKAPAKRAAPKKTPKKTTKKAGRRKR